MILHGDCLEALKELADNSVDMVLTSPPYDDLRSYNGLSFDQFRIVAGEIKRVMKPGAVCVWVVGDATKNGSESGTSFRQALHFKEIGMNIHDTMIYQKPHLAFPDSVRYYQSFEYMFVLSKGSPKTFNPIKDHKNVSHGRKVSGLDRQKNGKYKRRSGHGRSVPEYSVRRNVWLINAPLRNIGHPAPFPVSLAEDHIRSWTNEGDLVLDPFCGSGTTLVSAKRLRRNFIGIEREAEYVAIAQRRIDDA